MAVENTLRRAGPYVSNGTTTVYSFAFRVFKASEVGVVVSASADENATDTALVYLTDYTVTLNADQENNPGGAVTLSRACAQGVRVTVLSEVEATQEVQLTNHDGFSPKTINMVHDKLTILLQQIKEATERSLVIPATSNKTPKQILSEILEVADKANVYAEQAKQIYAEVVRLYDELESIRETSAEEVVQEGIKQVTAVKDEGATQIAGLQAEGSNQVANVQSEGGAQVSAIVGQGNQQLSAILAQGDAQAERLQNISDFEESGHGVRCQEFVTVLTQDFAEGSNVPLPSGFSYVVGRNHLHISVNGVDLMKPYNFNEIGVADTESSIVKINMPLVTGDEVKLWTVPLGRGLTDELVQRITDLENSLADLSRAVVYKE